MIVSRRKERGGRGFDLNPTLAFVSNKSSPPLELSVIWQNAPFTPQLTTSNPTNGI
jgi:hypothetical protein